MRSRFDGLALLVVLHLGVACASSVSGATGRARSLVPPALGAFWGDVHHVFVHNVQALVVVALGGVVFAGVASVVIFAVNGYVFGQMLLASDAALAWVWLYAPLELASFALGGAASTEIGLAVLRWVRRGARIESDALENWVVATLLATSGLAASAVLEGLAIRRAWTGG
jgi:hypothetical protein